MQIKYITLGLLVAAVASSVAELIKVVDTDVKAHNTASGILNGVKVKDVLNDLRVNVASKRSVLPRNKVARTVQAMQPVRNHSENEPDENENEPDENEPDENENEPDENECDENEPDENENEPDEEEADENEVNESAFSKPMRR